MIRKRLGRALDEAKRRRWVAALNSQPGAVAVEDAPMPKWGWGVPGGPYTGG